MSQQDPLNDIIDRTLNYGRHLINEFLGIASQKPMRVVLDVGAGLGEDLLLARSYNASCKLHAIEVHPAHQPGLEQRGIIVHSTNIERDRFPLSDASVDVIIANQVLEHVKEIFWVFHEATRVLRVGGYLIIGVPNLASLHNRFLLAFAKQPTCIQNHSAHVRGFTKSDLLKFLRLCFPDGYRLKRFGGSNFYPFPAFLARPLAVLLPNMAWGIFLLLEKQRGYEDEFIAHPAAHQLETNFYLGDG